MVIADPNSPFAAAGHALVACGEATSPALSAELESLGFRVTIAPDPYGLLLELLDRPLVYDAVVLSLPAVYRDELAVISTIRARVPHVEILLAHSDGRHAMLAEGMRLGATGLLGEEGIHRLLQVNAAFAPATVRPEPARNETPAAASIPPDDEEIAPSPGDVEGDDDAPLLTADELRALLAEQPTLPPT